MKTPGIESIEALRRANPRASAGFTGSVEAATEALRARLATAAAVEAAAEAGAEAAAEAGAPPRRGRHPAPRRRLARAAVGLSLAAAAAMAAVVTAGSPVGGPETASAAAAVRQAAAVTAAAAERSGTAVVRITRGGDPWAGTTIRWHDRDLAVVGDVPRRPGKAGPTLLVVDGTMYGIDPERGDWVVLGSPDSVDPDSGTTPDEYLAAVREDVGGATLRRITEGMTGLTTRRLGDGSTVYGGTVAAGLVARESGFKEGQAIRVLPFGHVAHDQAADPAAPLQAAVTVGAGGVVREIAVSWGTGASAWTYTVTYSRLGATPAPVAPEARDPLRERLRDAKARTGSGGR
jgi:hypothetical protein